MFGVLTGLFTTCKMLFKIKSIKTNVYAIYIAGTHFANKILFCQEKLLIFGLMRGLMCRYSFLAGFLVIVTLCYFDINGFRWDMWTVWWTNVLHHQCLINNVRGYFYKVVSICSNRKGLFTKRVSGMEWSLFCFLVNMNHCCWNVKHNGML